MISQAQIEKAWPLLTEHAQDIIDAFAERVSGDARALFVAVFEGPSIPEREALAELRAVVSAQKAEEEWDV
jgi:hypothetical protein